jgi:glutamyl-tRNA reductase
VLVGISHSTSDVQVRERASLDEAAAADLLRELARHGAVAEAVALSTCNRTEVYAVGPDAGAVDGAVRAALAAQTRIDEEALVRHGFSRHDDQVVLHLFRVAAGLDSMVLGESEIQGQVKSAWARAVELGTVGPLLNRLFRHALVTGKRVRRETRLGEGPGSLVAAALARASAVVGDLAGRRALVVGAGEMGRMAAFALRSRGVGQIVVANRAAAGRRLAGQVGGRAVGLDRVATELAAADLAVFATSSRGHVATADLVAAAARHGSATPLAIVDLAVPRDVAPEARSVPGVVVLDVDDVGRALADARVHRNAEVGQAEGIVAEESRSFVARSRSAHVAPLIESLRRTAEDIRRSELARHEVRLGSLLPDDREAVEAVTRAIVAKLLHTPMTRAREAAERGDEVWASAGLRDLFGLSV